MPYLIGLIVIVAIGVAFTFMQSDSTDEAARTDETTEARMEEVPEPVAPAVSEVNNDLPEAEDPATSLYADGEYTTTASYFTPKRTEHKMDITLTVADGVITDASVLYDGAAPETGSHKGFDEAYQEVVVGQELADLELSRVGGASLTSEAFNEALDTIRQDAAA